MWQPLTPAKSHQLLLTSNMLFITVVVVVLHGHCSYFAEWSRYPIYKPHCSPPLYDPLPPTYCPFLSQLLSSVTISVQSCIVVATLRTSLNEFDQVTCYGIRCANRHLAVDRLRPSHQIHGLHILREMWCSVIGFSIYLCGTFSSFFHSLSSSFSFLLPFPPSLVCSIFFPCLSISCSRVYMYTHSHLHSHLQDRTLQTTIITLAPSMTPSLTRWNSTSPKWG